MKCPQCGQWNRASFPRCFRCGQELPQAAEAPSVQQPACPRDMPEPDFVIQVDEEGNETARMDPRDRLAVEMQSLHARKLHGEARQQLLRARGAQRGFAPTGASVNAASRRNRVFREPQRQRSDPYQAQAEARPVDYDGFVSEPTYRQPNDHLTALQFDNRARTSTIIPLPPRQLKKARLFGPLRFVPYIAVLVLILGGGYGLYRYVVKPAILGQKETPLQERVQISASILDDMAAHTISIPAPEGAQIYIKELRKSYLSAGGYATLQVKDSNWYELKGSMTDPSMEVTLTPFIRTGSGEQKQMETIRYTVDIPLSPLTLITPDVPYLKVSTPRYNIKFHVLQNSTVHINGEDYSSYVNTQNGYITYNAPVQAIGDNVFHIVVNSQYYRQNEAKIVIHRAVQDIPLDLDPTLGRESSSPSMKIAGTTMPGAKIVILSPYQKPDFSQLDSTGVFSFEAVFNKIGNNTVKMEAQFPGKRSAPVEYEVYYLPSPTTYTKKAWALGDGFGYQDLMANMSTRIANTQIYVFTGPVLEIVSNKPQLAIFDASDGKNAQQKVLMENQTKTEWVLGQRYRIYGDAYGMYNGLPRLIARYTYSPKK